MEQLIVREKPPPVFASDEELVRRVINGETRVFALLMRRHNQKVFRAVRSILRDSSEVEDVMQQAYIAAYTHLASFAGKAKFSTWLLRIAINEALGRLRRARRRVLVESRIPESQEQVMSARSNDATPEQACSNRELAALIEGAVDELPDMYRGVFMFREVEGLTTSETATILGISPEVVKTRLHRARALLHVRLAALPRDDLALAFTFDGARCDRIVARVLGSIARLG